jgi:tRNA threonylcarbamoyladenosine biosynthesis protein TsaE
MNIVDQLRTGVVTRSAEEMRGLAEALARQLAPDVTLALHGNLGVGKTTFVQGLARGFGIKDAVTSPTFNIYTVHRSPGTRTLLHLDAYRLESSKEVDDLLLDEFLVSPWCLAVEWPEKIVEWLPSQRTELVFSIDAQQRHSVKVL